MRTTFVIFMGRYRLEKAIYYVLVRILLAENKQIYLTRSKNMESCQANVNNDYIDELRQEFGNINFNRIERTDGLYVTNSINLDLRNDQKIFTETQAKRTLRSSFSFFVSKNVKQKLSYFSQDEDKNSSEIYKYDTAPDLTEGETYAIQNIGHATQFIQIPDFNILTDPAFNSLNMFLYPSKTESHPTIDKFPKIDIIIISHNHRDHVDKKSLEQLLKHHNENNWTQPKVFVPLGNKKLFKDFGYGEVQEVDWYTKISVTKEKNGTNKTVNFISIPADHRSGRYWYDHHESLVTGWLINSEPNNVIFKFSGDTRRLSAENQMATDAVVWNEIKKSMNENNKDDNVEIPDIICFEPSGPNYTRSYMNITHQSTTYSALLKFLSAENLSKLSGKNLQEFLHKTRTIMMHHNKFELGPDRFNEGLFVFKKLIQYLHPSQDLITELERQKNKLAQNLDKEELKKCTPFTSRTLIATLPQETSLLVHAKDFIIEDLLEVINKGIDKEQIKEYLIKNTFFPKIGERINNEGMIDAKLEIENIQKYRGGSKKSK